MTIDQHREVGRDTAELCRRMAVLTRRTLGGRVPAAALDLALNVERRLTTLTIRLADAAEDAGGTAATRLYALDVPAVAPSPRPPRGRRPRLDAAEHRAAGAELYRLRERTHSLRAALD